VLRLISLIALVAALAACSLSADTPTPAAPDPLTLITEAADNIRAAATFRIDVNQEGPNYTILTEYAPVFFRRATAQYVAPREMQARIRVIALGLPIDIEVYSRGADQWYSAVWTGNNWINQPFAPGFNPETLIAEDTGVQSALNALIELAYIGEEALENGTSVYHISGRAQGDEVAALLAGLIAPVGEVTVDVYVHRETRLPARFEITEYDSPYAETPEPGETAEPIKWIIDVYDYDAAPDLNVPQLEATAEATADAVEPPSLFGS
jgi:hypothetical protein